MTDGEKPSSAEFQFATDRPITTRTEDRLDRGSFAANLATAIAASKADESLVIALYGPWGSGKSSVKNLVCEALAARADGAPDILEFNPWQWRGHDDVSVAFFREVLRRLGRPDTTDEQKKTAKVFRRYARFLGVGGVLFGGPRVIAGLLSVVSGLSVLGLPVLNLGGATAVISKVAAVAAVLMGSVLVWGEKLLDRIAGWFDAQSEMSQQSLEEQKQRVATALLQCETPTLVIIDDIDRLSTSEIRTVFQLIKANLDFPRFIYLLLFQRDIVEAALQEEIQGYGVSYLAYAALQ